MLFNVNFDLVFFRNAAKSLLEGPKNRLLLRGGRVANVTDESESDMSDGLLSLDSTSWENVRHGTSTFLGVVSVLTLGEDWRQIAIDWLWTYEDSALKNDSAGQGHEVR